MITITLGLLTLQFGISETLFLVSSLDTSRKYVLSLPQFEVGGSRRSDFRFIGYQATRALGTDGLECSLLYESQEEPKLRLEVLLKYFPRYFRKWPLIQFRLNLTAEYETRLTQEFGQNSLTYFRVTGWEPDSSLLLLPQPNQLVTGRLSSQERIRPGEWKEGEAIVSPMVFLEGGQEGLLIGCLREHEVGETVFDFTLRSGSEAVLEVAPAEGTCPAGLQIGPETPFSSVWFSITVLSGERLSRLREG